MENVTHLGRELRRIVSIRIGPKKVQIADKEEFTLAQVLRTQPDLSVGQACTLKVEYVLHDTDAYRIWLSRCGLADGEPFEETVYLEEYTDDRWVDVGYFDGGMPFSELSGNPDWAIVALDGSVIDRFFSQAEAYQEWPKYGPPHLVERVPDPGTL